MQMFCLSGQSRQKLVVLTMHQSVDLGATLVYNKFLTSLYKPTAKEVTPFIEAASGQDRNGRSCL